MILAELFSGFLKVGLFAFGGAYGAIPLIRDIVLSHGWLTDDMLTSMIAISESTPGPVMINLATYVGYQKAGIAGSLLSTLAVVLPSFLIILMIVMSLKTILKNQYAAAILGGLKPCIIGIILSAGVTMTASHLFRDALTPDLKNILLTLILCGILWGAEPVLRKKVSPVLLIVIAAVLGVFLL